MNRLPVRLLRIAIATCLLVGWANVARAAPNARQTARQLDRLLAEELFDHSTALAPRVDDSVFLRRVWLDIVGDIPTPEEITEFRLEPAGNKRQRIVRKLLADPQYGQNWARYWRDVILSRKLEDRATIVAEPLVADLTKKFNANQPWSEIATEFITATGDVRSDGTTAILLAQDGRTEETAAEVARIFLGIQIQCCQCHDHPYDSWKREQFHELAAFFPRIAVRPVLTPTRRTLEVIGQDVPERRRRPNANARRAQAEHYMPDLDDPSAPGTRMQPRFFLTDAELPFGTSDEDRRATIAQWITANPWFATAFVNRVWSELVGEGFYEPIDDIGPERTPSAPRTVEFVARQFADSGYDVKWLLRTICATEAYQRESRPRRAPDATPYTANTAQPLRSDQLFNAILTAVDVDEADVGARRARRAAGAYQRTASPRDRFAVTFGFDPSDPRESISGSIPQTLAMMNGARLNLAVRASHDQSLLNRLLQQIDEDEDIVVELYLRTLSREPTDQELAIVLEFFRSTRNRAAALEDLFWALLNTSEFSHRR